MGRRQVDGDTADREGETAVFDGGAYSLPGLVHRRVWQTHDGEGGQAAGQIAFHRHGITGDTMQAERTHVVNHGKILQFKEKIEKNLWVKTDNSPKNRGSIVAHCSFCKKYCNTNPQLCEKNKEKSRWMNLQKGEKVINYFPSKHKTAPNCPGAALPCAIISTLVIILITNSTIGIPAERQ